MIDGKETEETFALVAHPIEPRILAAPMHTHQHEDEYTYVLEGEVGVQVGEEVRVARPGDLVLKPRHVPHAFWNAGDLPARALEIISPRWFRKVLRGDRHPAPPPMTARSTSKRSVS